MPLYFTVRCSCAAPTWESFITSGTKRIFCWLLAALMIAAGVMHWVSPDGFARIVPPYLPYPYALVYISGFFEILGGIGLLLPATRRAAAWGLIALYVAVFPANIHMAIHHTPFFGKTYPIAGWVRLPFQAVLIAWAWWLGRRDASQPAREIPADAPHKR